MNEYILIVNDGKIIIQKSEYIEDGWFIHVLDERIILYEIPQFGGEPYIVDEFSTIIQAIQKGESLT